MGIHVGVVGAGIVGLSAAINIQKLMKLVKVTVLADSFGVDTIHADKAGIFLPVPSRIKGVDAVTAKEWLIDSYNHHSVMADSALGLESGQEFMSGVCMFTEKSGQHNLPLQSLVRNFHLLSEEDKASLNYTHDNVCYFETVVVDEVKYLRWLMKEFRENGGIIKYKSVNALQELYGMFDVVVNCTGRRTREMVVDPLFTFIDTRTVQLKRQLHKKFILDDKFCVLPHIETDLWDVSWITQPKDTSFDIIMDDTNSKLLQSVAKARMPQLEGSDYVTEWREQTNLREPPMVEIEMIRCVRGQGPILPVVHNVGHGREAITLAWGTGAYAAHLVQDCRRLVQPFTPIWRPFDPTS